MLLESKLLVDLITNARLNKKKREIYAFAHKHGEVHYDYSHIFWICFSITILSLNNFKKILSCGY